MPQKDLITNPDDIRLREQDQLQAILGRPPSWILRWGISLIGLAILLLLWLSWLVKFPDIIPARVVLTTEIPPLHLFAQSDGKIAALKVKDKQSVHVNELLAEIENPANYADVIALEVFLKKIKDQSLSEMSKVSPPVNLLLGELQNPFSTFTQNLKAFSFFQNKNEIVAKTIAFEAQIDYLKRMNLSLQKQEVNLGEAVALANSNLQRMETLLASKSGSVVSVENAKAEVLRNERDLEQLQSSILQNNFTVKDLELQIINLKENRSDGKNEKTIALRENVEVLLSSIENWKQKFLILAPMDGQVSFTQVLNQNQFVKSGQEIMTIVPSGGVGKLTGKAWLPSNNSGKVLDSMVVNIRLDGFPFQEYGVVKSSVKSKSTLPQEGYYLVELNVPAELETTYGKKIPFQQEMQGTGNIITDDRRILERVFDRFLNLTKN